MSRKERSRLATTTQYSFSLNGTSLPYILKRSYRARYLRLEIKPEIGLVVVSPRNCSITFIENFIQEKRGWILKQLAKSNDTCHRNQKHEITSGGTIYLYGHSINIVERSLNHQPATAMLQGENLLVNLDHSHKSLQSLIADWYHFKLNIVLTAKLVHWSRQMGIQYRGYKIRGQRTRWGSCSRNGNLSFNWKLLMTPDPVIEYVVIHELAHLREMNHSSRFWNLVAHYCSQYKIHRKWLRDQNHLLSFS